MLTDLSFPVTAKKLGPSAVALTRAKVFYLKSSDLLKLEADSVRNAAILKVAPLKQKVELFESPDEFLAAQALSQGATANPNFAKAWQNLAPTSATAEGNQNVASKYLNDITTVNGGYVRLPDPFVRRLVILHNQTTGSINVNARGTTSPIDGSTGGYVLAAGKRRHFVAPTAATAGTTAGWLVAKDA